ncbi:MAG: peptide-methionine (S)-S-oxide reductase MsrA [Magnetococcales bacterium]|nr:peptide-methionine (S)-S-oxide reductase MsrA [Magnetococcales bacterium]
MAMMFFGQKSRLPEPHEALPGRSTPMVVRGNHHVTGHGMMPPFPAHMETALFGMGCFWGAERRFWQQKGVYVTAVGYAGGLTPNPTYEEVCTGKTGHNEVVLVVFDPGVITYDRLLQVFWESHDPTQGMRQGNDVGTQYRSGIYTANATQHASAMASRASYAESLRAFGHGAITTEIVDRPAFYYAEGYHQQYLAKNPSGYCGLGGTGVVFAPGATAGSGKKTLSPAASATSPVPGMMRLLAGKPLDEVILDPANPNLLVRDE